MTQDPTNPEGEPQDAAPPAGEAPADAGAASGEGTSGVDNWVEEGGPLEPQDVTEAPDGAEGADQATTQLAERTADLQRLQAEYVNYKRRVDRDRELVRENATYTVLSSMLPVLDDIDRAREHGEVTGGFKAVADSLDRVVTGLGLVRFGEPGEEFDPNQHEALMQREDAEATSTTVENVAQAGYRIGERVVRAAKVTVVGPA
ncbi:hypothetical protein GCM10011519_18330 [Marmoricola endophyticus]|uniref:Protein GrpE n=1 Tax=Marmoricola endophyticus TaxID=2040280 RepID=A0A917F4A6_9ACTN|nr:nucleotide exchange factor GrpE [Marmoricola endophyticus]GGF44839.1 hypothetical protein GCM10011519_18330 [Marmoricola endophyticus]